MTTLLDLPGELIPHILSHLDPESIFATRLANKHLETSSFSYFGRRFFRKKGYLITTPSITVLKSIAAHEKLRKYVRHVWFNPDCYTFVEPACAPENDWEHCFDDQTEAGRRGRSLWQQESRRYHTYLEVMKDHEQLLSRPRLAAKLTTAFSTLPNLAVIGMRRSEDHRPWGWSRLEAAIGEDPRVLGPTPDRPQLTLSGPTKLFTAIVNSVADAHVSLQRLYTDAIEIDHLLPKALPPATLHAACENLLYLEINVSRGWLGRYQGRYYTEPESEALCGLGLVELLRAAPRLRELGLQVFPDLQERPIRYAWTSESWKQCYSYRTFQTVACGVTLGHLTRLKLEKITATDADFEAFIAPSRAGLISLKIRDVRLLSTDSMARPWQRFFEFLRDGCPALSYFLLYHLLHEAGGISFAPQSSGLDLGSAAEDHGTEGAPVVPHNVWNGRSSEGFTEYDDIAVEAEGRFKVEKKLTEIAERHWYQRPLFSYAMDEAIWHTDTSDEE